MALNNYRQSGGGGYSMLTGTPVIYDKQQEIRQLLIDEVRSRRVLRQSDYPKTNWSLVRGPDRVTFVEKFRVMPPAVPAVPHFPAGTRYLRIIATNDFHGALEPRPDANGVRRGGAAYVAAAIDRARNECVPRCQTLLVDAGDLFQGTPASNLSYGRPVVEYYNRMGYAASALGNHEFDYTSAGLAKTLNAAAVNFGFNTPIVASNMRLNGDTALAPFVGDGKLIEATHVEQLPGGLTVGYIGLMGKNAAADIFGGMRGVKVSNGARSMIKVVFDATRTLANTELLPEAKNLICRRLTSADSYHRRESGFLRKLRKRVAQAVA